MEDTHHAATADSNNTSSAADKKHDTDMSMNCENTEGCSGDGTAQATAQQASSDNNAAAPSHAQATHTETGASTGTETTTRQGDEPCSCACDDSATETDAEPSAHTDADESAESSAASSTEPSTQTQQGDLQAQIDTLTDQLARARADLYNLNTQYQNYVRRSKEAASQHYQRGQADVLEALITILDDIHAARQAGDLKEGPFASIADKLENTLETRFQLTRYGKAGDEFDPQLHEALLARENADVRVATVGQVLQPGYKHHDTVLRPTKVSVDNPASSAS